MPLLAQAIAATKDKLINVLLERPLRLAWNQCFPRLAAASTRQRLLVKLSQEVTASTGRCWMKTFPSGAWSNVVNNRQSHRNSFSIPS
jgi:hypothetical protein